MIYFSLTIVVFAVLTGALTTYAIKAGGNKAALLSIFCGLVTFVLVMTTDMMGQAKPIWAEWRELDRIRVISFTMDRTARVTYFWVIMDGRPVAYSKAWPEGEGEEDAAKLEEQFRDARYNNQELVLSDDAEEGYEFEEPRTLPDK